MERRTFYALFVGLLCLIGFSTGLQAQSVTGITFTSNTTCAGGALTVSYTVSSTFTSGNEFVAYLSDNTGFFSTTPAEIGRVTSTTAGSINVTIPASTGSSSSYRIGIAATKPATKIVSSAGTLTVSSPGVPGTSPVSYCQGQPASSLQATPASGATLNWYGTNSSGGTASPVPPVPSTNTAGLTTYYVSQTLNGCEGGRVGIVVTVTAKPAAPTSSATTSYCQNQPAAALTANGTNLKWYGSATSTAGSSVAPTPNTSSVGSIDYFVSQTVNGCESDRTTITITTKASPAAPAVAAGPTYCQNQTASALSATPSTGGTLNWYGTSQTGGTASGNATVPATTQAGTTPYYVSQTVNGCESARASISVTVNGTPAAPGVANVSLCNNGPSQPLTASGTNLKWYDANDNTLNGAPTPGTGSAGTLTYKVSQVSSAGCEGPKAVITVTVNAIPAAPSVSAPGPYCSGTTASALIATGQNLKWYGANQTGGTASTNATIPNTAASAIGTTTYYVTQTVNGCESARAGIPVEVRSTPGGPAVAAVAFCQGTPAPVLSATATTGATLNWYGTNASGGSSSPTAPTPGNTASAMYYVSQTLNGCEGPRSTLPVTVNATPAAPGVANVSLCNNGPSRALTASGTNLKWYDANDASLGNTAPTPGTNAATTLIYKVTQTSTEGCESPKATVTVVVSPLPAAPGVSTVTYCQSQQDQPVQNVSPVTATGTNLKWYNANGNLFSSAPTPSISTAGTTIFQVTQTVSGCEGPKASLQVIVNTTSSPTVSQTLVTYCLNDKAVPLTATAETGGSLRWIDPYGNVTQQAPTPLTLNTSVDPAGDRFFVYQIGANGCYSSRVSIRSLVNARPSVPSSLSNVALCNNGPSQPLSATPLSGNSLKWYDANDNLLNGAPTPGTGSVGNLTYKVTQTSSAGCESPKSTITVTINAIPDQPTVSAAGPYCAGTAASALAANGQSLKWYGISQTGGTASGNATVPGTAVSDIGTTTYYVTQTVNGCESGRAGIPVIVKTTPGGPSVSPIEFCQGYTAPVLMANPVSGATINWYGTNAKGGTASLTAPVPDNSTVGTTNYYVNQVLDGCPSVRTSLSVRVKATPTAPGVTSVSLCNNGPSQPLVASAASGNTLKWYDGNDSALNGAPTPNTGTPATLIYKVTQTSGEGCESNKSTISVIVYPLPAAPVVAAVSYCQAQQDQPAQSVGPVTASGANLRWYNTDGNAFGTAPTPSITTAGTTTFQVTQTVNNCEGPKASLQVVVNTTTAPVVSQTLVTYCKDDKATPLVASAETGGSLRWVDPYGNVTQQAPTPLTLNTSVDPAGDKFFVYQIGANGCYSPRATIRALVNTTPTLSLSAVTPTVNLGQRAAIRLKFTSVPPYSYTVTGGYSGVVRSADTTISVLPRATTIYQIVTVSNVCGTGIPGNPATAQVTVNVPTVTASSLASASLCAGSSLSVPFTTTGQFNTGNLFRAELVSVADTSKKYVLTATTTASPISGTLPASLPSGLYYVRVNADNPEIGVIGGNSPTQLNVRALASGTLTGTQNIYEGAPASLTLALAGDAPWQVTYADSLRSYSATVSTTPYLLEVRPTHTTTYRLLTVNNNCGSGPVSGTATVSVLPLLGVQENTLDPLVKTYPIPTQTVLMVELDLPLAREPARLSLTDFSGRTVLEQTTQTQKNQLDLTTQHSGIYLLRIQVGDRQTVRKILKQ